MKSTHLKACLLSFSIGLAAMSQAGISTVWNYIYASDWSLTVESATTTADGRILAVANEDLPSGPRIQVINLNPNGTLAWQRNYQSPDRIMAEARDVIVDGSGNVWVCGVASNGTTAVQDGLVLKYSPTGSLLRTFLYNGPDSRDDFFTQIRALSDGSVAVIGTVETAAGHKDGIVLRLGGNADIIWDRIVELDTTDTQDDELTSLNVRNDKIYVFGHTYQIFGRSLLGGRRFDIAGNVEANYDNPLGSFNGALNSTVVGSSGRVYVAADIADASPFRTFINKWEMDGSSAEFGAKVSGSDKEARVAKILLDQQGNMIVGGTITSETPGRTDGIIAKYDPNFNLIWWRLVDIQQTDERLLDIALDPGDGSVYATGSVQRANLRGHDMLTVKLGANGQVIWNRIIGTGSPKPSSMGVRVLPSGHDTPTSVGLISRGNNLYQVHFQRVQSTSRIEIRLQSTDFAVRWNTLPVTVKFYAPGTSNVVATFPNIVPNAGGSMFFNVTKENYGAFDIRLERRGMLQPLIPNYGIYGQDQLLLADGIFGDVDRDNAITIFDYIELSAAFDSTPGHPAWNENADLDEDGDVSIFDYVILSLNFDKQGG